MQFQRLSSIPPGVEGWAGSQVRDRGRSSVYSFMKDADRSSQIIYLKIRCCHLTLSNVGEQIGPIFFLCHLQENCRDSYGPPIPLPSGDGAVFPFPRSTTPRRLELTCLAKELLEPLQPGPFIQAHLLRPLQLGGCGRPSHFAT